MAHPSSQSRIALITGAALTLFVSACGGDASATADASGRGDRTSGSERSREPNDGAQITGLMGTLRPDQVQMAMEPRQARLAQCFQQRMGEVELLGGDVRMSYRVHTDGSVAWVYMSESTVGDRATELCILDVARRTRFPRPSGGEAEFTWSFGLDPADDLRPADTWQHSSLADLHEDLPGIAAECGATGSVTAYVEPGGQVLAAGGTTASAEDSASTQLECFLERMRALTLPDPGSYTAKVTIGIP